MHIEFSNGQWKLFDCFSEINQRTRIGMLTDSKSQSLVLVERKGERLDKVSVVQRLEGKYSCLKLIAEDCLWITLWGGNVRNGINPEQKSIIRILSALFQSFVNPVVFDDLNCILNQIHLLIIQQASLQWRNPFIVLKRLIFITFFTPYIYFSDNIPMQKNIRRNILNANQIIQNNIQRQQKQQMIEWIKKATNVFGNYKFHVKSQPDDVDSGSTISVTAYTDKSQKAIVPCHIKWFRIRNGLCEETFKYKGNLYVCDPTDIGAIIMAQVTSNDTQYSGQAKIQFGPVKISAQVKKHLMDTLTNGSTIMRGMVCLNDSQMKQCQFKIFQDMVKIQHLQSDLNYSFRYNSIQPRLQLNPKDQTKLAVVFNYTQNSPIMWLKTLFGIPGDQMNNSNNEGRIDIRFSSKQVKQIFYFTLKSFNAKHQLKNSAIMQKIEGINFNQHENINLLLEIDALRSDLSRLYYSNELKQKEIYRLRQLVERRQRQIQQIVTTYTRMAEDKLRNQQNVNESYYALTSKRDDVFGRKCQNLQKQNLDLNERIRLLTAQIDDIRFNSSIVKKNQTIVNPNFTHVTAIQMANPTKNQITSFDNMLSQFSQSRVTSFNEDTFLMTQKLQKVNEQKSKLEQKLQKSFRTIDDLQKKLNVHNQSMHNNSAVQFNYGKKEMPEIHSSSTNSMIFELDKFKNQNSRLVISNESLKKQNINLQKELSNASSRIIIQPSPSVSPIVAANQNMKQSLKMASNKQHQLVRQIQGLRNQIANLRTALKNQQNKSERLLRQKISAQRKLQDVLRQLQMYKKNQSVLNRSQNLSMEMESYNEEQIKVLKQNNQFLVSENEKLSKACEKFMMQARQNPKLRKQILMLKQNMNHLKVLNPERSDIKSIFSNSGYNQLNNSQSDQISEVIGKNEF